MTIIKFKEYLYWLRFKYQQRKRFSSPSNMRLLSKADFLSKDQLFKQKTHEESRKQNLKRKLWRNEYRNSTT